MACASLYSIKAPRSIVSTPPNCNRSHPLRMHINAFSGVEHVQIIEVPDKRGPDNQGSTVLRSGVYMLDIHKIESRDKKCILGEKTSSVCMHNMTPPLFYMDNHQRFQTVSHWNVYLLDLWIKDTSLFCTTDTSSGPKPSYCMVSELYNKVKTTPPSAIASSRWLVYKTRTPDIQISPSVRPHLGFLLLIWVVSVMQQGFPKLRKCYSQIDF